VRRALLATAICLALGVAQAQSRTVGVPGALHVQIAAARKANPKIAVLLPSRLPLDYGGRVYGSGGPVAGGYAINLDATARCHGADACFLAFFGAQRGGRLYGARLRLEHGVMAAYRPLSCGASCAPPQIDWLRHGVLYTIQARLSVGQTRTALIGAADQAIAAGPR
jgi:hypothetical protein